jgi:pimeloyl-ACP methyl ester carboxylesterase
MLLLVHGFLSSSRQWQLNLDALAEVCQPVTAELWGHGESPAPEDLDLYTPAAYVAQFEAIRRELDADRWLVAGYSLGAGLTARYAHDHAEHIYGHIMTNSSSGFAHDEQVAQWRATAEVSAAKIEGGGLKAIGRIPVHPRHARRLPEPVYSALVEDANRLDPTGVANAMRETSPNASIRDIAHANPRPALLCFGQHEKRFAPLKDWAVEHMANLELATLDAGHAVNMEDAPGFNRAACRFIETCLTSSTR